MEKPRGCVKRRSIMVPSPLSHLAGHFRMVAA